MPRLYERTFKRKRHKTMLVATYLTGLIILVASSFIYAKKENDADILFIGLMVAFTWPVTLAIAATIVIPVWFGDKLFKYFEHKKNENLLTVTRWKAKNGYWCVEVHDDSDNLLFDKKTLNTRYGATIEANRYIKHYRKPTRTKLKTYKR